MKQKIFKRVNRHYSKNISLLLINKGLLFCFILLLPSQLGKHFFFDFSYLSGVRVDYLAPTLYLTDILAALLFLINFKTVVLFFRTKKIFLILSLLFLNTLFAYSRPISIYHYFKIIELLIIFAIFASQKINEKTILLGFLTAGVVELLLSLLQFINKHSLQGIFYFLGERYFTLGTPGIAKAAFDGVEFLRPYATFSHPNSLAGFYLLLYFFVLTNKKFNKFFYLKSFSLFIFSCLIFISFSKAAILTFLLLNSLYFISAWKSICKICLISRLTLFTVVSLIFLQATNDPLSWHKRLELLKNASVIISQHPILGVGLGNYLFAQSRFFSKYYLFFNQPVHNVFLLFFAEAGLPLSFYILYQLFIVFKKTFPSMLYPLLSILITGVFDHYWLTLQQNFLLTAVIGGLVLKLL